MHILHLENTDEKHPAITGGAIRHLQIFKEWTETKKAEITIIDNDSIFKSRFYKELKDNRVNTKFLVFKYFKDIPYIIRQLYSIIATIFLGIFKAENFDAIYTDFVPALILPAIIVGKIRRKRVIFVVQLLHLKKDRSLKERFYESFLSWANLVIVTNPIYKKYIKNKKTFFNGNAVSSEFFPIPDAKKEYDLCFIGSVTDDRKGIKEFVKCSENLYLRNHIKKALIITQSRDLSFLNSLITRENIFEIRSNPPHAEINLKLNRSKIFLFPSSSESYGLVIGEALKAGIPVIIKDIPEFKIWRGLALFSNNFEEDIIKVLREYSRYQERIKTKSKAYNLLNTTWKEIAQKELQLLGFVAEIKKKT